MSEADLVNQLRERFAEAVLQAEADAEGALRVAVKPEALLEVCRFLSTEAQPAYPYLSDAFGADYEDHLQVMYHLFRSDSGSGVLVSTSLPRDDPTLPTLTVLYSTANWAEREIAEMFGVTFAGHPDPRKLLLPEDWQGYPLRKDYRRPDHPYLNPEPLHENPPVFLGFERPAAPGEAEAE